MDISRRHFLQTSLAFSALTLLPACSLSRRTSLHHGRFVYEMTAEPATAEVVPGFATDVLAFNGAIPAPTIRCRQGEEVIIHFTNKLNEPTTIH